MSTEEQLRQLGWEPIPGYSGMYRQTEEARKKIRWDHISPELIRLVEDHT